MNAAEVVFGAALGALLGTVAANFGLRLRLMRLEHEVWGVQGTNGMKSSLVQAHERLDRFAESLRVYNRKANRRTHDEPANLEEDE